MGTTTKNKEQQIYPNTIIIFRYSVVNRDTLFFYCHSMNLMPNFIADEKRAGEMATSTEIIFIYKNKMQLTHSLI